MTRGSLHRGSGGWNMTEKPKQCAVNKVKCVERGGRGWRKRTRQLTRVLSPLRIHASTVDPLRTGGPGCRVSSATKAQAGGTDEGKSKTGPHVSAHIGVSSVPFLCKHRSELFAGSVSFRASQTVDRENERSEVAPASQASCEVLAFLFLLVSLQHLYGGRSAVRRGIRVSDTYVEDCRCSASAASVTT